MLGACRNIGFSCHQLPERIAMGIISMIIVGFIVGLIARAIMPGEQKLGIIMTVILGIVGALVAGYLGHALGWYAPGQGAGWIGSIVGAIIVLFIYGLIVKKS
jgi:uncharacterized membrane protein YeaQ/YmgE (transglycosylase-associated protein family)